MSFVDRKMSDGLDRQLDRAAALGLLLDAFASSQLTGSQLAAFEAKRGRGG